MQKYVPALTGGRGCGARKIIISSNSFGDIINHASLIDRGMAHKQYIDVQQLHMMYMHIGPYRIYLVYDIESILDL